MASMEERNKTLVLEAFNTLFNKRDYEAALQFVPAAGMSPFGAVRESGIGTFETCRDVRFESALGGKAENICSQRAFRLLTRFGHSVAASEANCLPFLAPPLQSARL
jgi:hypothetical protein